MSTPPDPPDPTGPPESDAAAHKRRVRYKGTHPKRFEERYKELAGDPDEVAHVLAKGRTPAGQHVPIMVEEVLAVLAPEPGMRGVDCTLGFGGHAQRLLERITPGGTLLGLDADPLQLPRAEARLRKLGYDENAFVAKRSNFAGFTGAIMEQGWHDGVDLVLADLGVSSMQIDDPSRGFTYGAEGPLDMRMNPARGVSAAQWLERASLEDMERVLRDNGDEPRAGDIARCAARPRGDHHPTGGTRARGVGRRARHQRDRSQCAARVPGASHRGQRRVRRARCFTARSAVRAQTRWPRRDIVVPFGRGPPREEGVPGGRAQRHLCGGRPRRDPRRHDRALRQSTLQARQAALGAPGGVEGDLMRRLQACVVVLALLSWTAVGEAARKTKPPIILLDLNYTFVENQSETAKLGGEDFGDRLRFERYRKWLHEMVRDHYVILITARPNTHKARTLARIDSLLGWQPDEAWFNEHDQWPAVWKQEALHKYIFPRHGKPSSGTRYLAIESNPRTAFMYEGLGIPAMRVWDDWQYGDSTRAAK
jgi:hypothetical protein